MDTRHLADQRLQDQAAQSPDEHLVPIGTMQLIGAAREYPVVRVVSGEAIVIQANGVARNIRLDDKRCEFRLYSSD